jgi:Fe-S-cluster containining protein
VYHGDQLIPLDFDLPACTACAKCCYLVVEIKSSDLQVPEEFIVEHAGVRCMDQRGDGACVALDPLTRHCTIYEHRPQVCRDFARGESLCRRQVLTLK